MHGQGFGFGFGFVLFGVEALRRSARANENFVGRAQWSSVRTAWPGGQHNERWLLGMGGRHEIGGRGSGQRQSHMGVSTTPTPLQRGGTLISLGGGTTRALTQRGGYQDCA